MLCSTGFLKNPSINKLGGGGAVDLVAAPASQAYAERIFSVCGDCTAEKKTRPKKLGEESFLEH